MCVRNCIHMRVCTYSILSMGCIMSIIVGEEPIPTIYHSKSVTRKQPLYVLNKGGFRVTLSDNRWH